MKIGFFGKLPGYGDFVQRGVPPVLADGWDNWILQCFETTQSQLAATWQEIYFNSPIWRFTLAPGLLMDEAISGIMMPSVDSAGRSYPFTVFCQPQHSVNCMSLSAHLDPYHAKSEDFMLSLLDKNRPDLDEIAQLLIKIYDGCDATTPEDSAAQAQRSGQEIYRAWTSHADKAHFRFTQHLLAQSQQRVSIWNTVDALNVCAQFRYYRGLPPVDAFTSLLAGR